MTVHMELALPSTFQSLYSVTLCLSIIGEVCVAELGVVNLLSFQSITWLIWCCHPAVFPFILSHDLTPSCLLGALAKETDGVIIDMS